MAPIDVEKSIEELTLGEKVALTAGMSRRNPSCLPAMMMISLGFYSCNAPPLQANADSIIQDVISGTRHPFHA
jgi:hypothetical protein